MNNSKCSICGGTGERFFRTPNYPEPGQWVCFDCLNKPECHLCGEHPCVCKPEDFDGVATDPSLIAGHPDEFKED